MSMCKICHRDSAKHSEKTWVLHQQKQRCAFCGENREVHSEKLWNIHEAVSYTHLTLPTIYSV